jgi:raffinose/stachyose/melibiose transport system substrate-binding protein
MSIGAPALAQDAEPIALRVNAENASKDSLTALANAYMEQNPNVAITLDFRDSDSYYATVVNVADLPDAPDIFLGNQGYRIDGTLVGAGLVAPLDPYYEQYGWTDWYSEGIRDQFRFSEDGTTFGDGPIWGISESADFVGIFYNRAKLEQLGLEAPATFADLEAAMGTAAEAGELPVKLGNLLGWPAPHVLATVQGASVPAGSMRDWVFGVDDATYASPDNLQAVQTFKAWIDNGWIDGPAANGLDYDQAWQEFADGDGVFLPAGTWLTADLYERMGDDVGFMAPPPGASGTVGTAGAVSLPFHISSKSAHQDAAAAFIDFVMNPENGQSYYDAGRVPASAGSQGAPADPLTAEVAEAWARITADDGLMLYQDWATDTMGETLNDTLQELIADRTTPEDFVATVQEDWEAFHADR